MAICPEFNLLSAIYTLLVYIDIFVTQIFYSFVYTKELSEKIISKCQSDYTVMKVISNSEEDEILDFEEKDVRDKFQAFRNVFLQHIKIINEQFGKPSNTYNQHVIDGLVIENFINELAR